MAREHGGHAVANYHAQSDIFGVHGYGDTMFAASDIGWVVGHSYCVYGPLLRGAKTLIVEGKPVGNPDHLSWFRLLEKHRVNSVFCAPTAIRAIKKESSSSSEIRSLFNLSCLRAWFVAGEKCDATTFHWLKRALNSVPVYDNWWQTETGWPITSMGFVGSYGSVPAAENQIGGIAVPGFSVSLSKDKDILIKLPLPPGAATKMLGDESGKSFEDKYCSNFPGYYLTGDCGEIDENGLVTVVARVDDVINVSGHRLTTSQLEEAVMKLKGISECAVIGKHDPLKGQVPVAFVVASDFVQANEVVEIVREHVGNTNLLLLVT